LYIYFYEFNEHRKTNNDIYLSLPVKAGNQNFLR